MDWQMTDARHRLGEVVDRALREGPQRVTRRGEAVIVLSETDYQRLRGQRKSFKAHLMEGPDFEDLDLERDTTPMRPVDL